MSPVQHRLRTVVLYSVLALVALANSGCLALLLGGAAAGGAVGYAYVNGNSYKDFLASLGPTLSATDRAIRDMGLPVLDGKMGEATAEIESRTPQGDKISIYLEPVPGATFSATRVHIRIGWFGDQELSDRLHDRIAAHLQQQAPVVLGGPSIVDNPSPPATPQGISPVVHTREPPLATPKK